MGILAFLLGVALVTTGCHQAKGGGWIPSTVPGAKATFGFTARCVEGDEQGFPFEFYEGQVEWDDHGANVTFHGDVEVFTRVGVGGPVTDCESAAEFLEVLVQGSGGEAQLEGTYRPQSPGGPGSFTMLVQDDREPGINGDTVSIELVGGQYSGYTNSGTIRGGNIQVD